MASAEQIDQQLVSTDSFCNLKPMTLTQNPVVLEHLVDVHAHLLDGQLQRQCVDVHVRAGRALLIRYGALQIGRYSVCKTITHKHRHASDVVDCEYNSIDYISYGR